MEPPGGNQVGRAYASIFGDDAPFKRTVRNLARTTIRRITATITGDADPARREVASLKAWAESLLGTLNFDVDMRTGPSHARLAVLQSQTRVLANELKDLDVDLDTDEGRAKLEAFLARIRRLRDTAIDIGVDFDDADLNASLAGLKARLASATQDIEVRLDIDGAGAVTKATGLRGWLEGIFADPIEQEVDVDGDSAARSIRNVSRAAGDGQSSIRKFADWSTITSKVLQGVLLIAIAGALSALAPLTAMLTIAAGGMLALGAAAGLVGAALFPTIRALSDTKANAEALETAEESLASATDAVADARDNRGDVEKDVARSIQEAREAIAEATEEERRVEQENNRAIADARERATDQAQRLREAEVARAEAIADATDQYRDALEDLDQIRSDNIRREREARAALVEAQESYADAVRDANRANQEARRDARQAEGDYVRTIVENRRREREAILAVREAEQNLRDTRIEAAERVADAEESLADAREQYARTVQRANELVERAYENAARAAERVRDAEMRLDDMRRRLRDSIEKLTEAQEAYNRAARNEPLREEEAEIGFERAQLREQELLARRAELEEELRLARFSGDTRRIADLEREYAGLRLDQRQNTVDLIEAEQRLNDLREEGSPELQRAREAVEQAWYARRDAYRDRVEAQQALLQARKDEQTARQAIQQARAEADEMISDAYERVIDAREALLKARQDAADRVREAELRLVRAEQEVIKTRRENVRSEREASMRVRESYRRMAETRRSGAESIEDAGKRVIAAELGVRDALEENAKAVEDGQERVAKAYENLMRTRRDQNRAVLRQEEALRDAHRDIRDTIEESERRAKEARSRTVERQEAYRIAIEDGADRIEEAEDRINEALERQAKAQDEVTEAAREAGATLTASQQALYDAAIAFGTAFMTAFGPASEKLNWFGVRLLDLAQRALPFLGQKAYETVTAIIAEFDRLIPEILGTDDVERYRHLFDRLPQIASNAFGAVLNFVFGLFNILVQAAPHMEGFWTWLNKIATQFREWTESVGGQNAIREWLSSAKDMAEALLRMVVSIVTNIWEFSQQEGPQLFLREIMRLIGNIFELLPLLAPVFRIVGSILWGINRFIELVVWAGNKVREFILGIWRLLPEGLRDTLRPITRFLSGLGTVAAVGLLAGIILFRRPIFNALKGLFGGFNKEKEGTAANVGWFGRWSKRIFWGIGAAILAAGRAIGRGIGAALRGLGRGIRFMWRQAGQLLRSVGDWIARLLRRSGTAVRDAYRAIGRGLRAFGTSVGTLVERIVNSVGRNLGRLIRFIRRIPGNIVWMLHRFAAGAGRFLGNLGGHINGFFRAVGRALGRIPGMFGRLLTGIGRALSRWVASIPRLFTGLINLFRGVFGGRGVLLGILRAFVGRVGVRGLLRGLLLFLGVSNPVGWIAIAASYLIGPFARMLAWFLYEFKPRIWALFKSLFGPRDMMLSELANFREAMFNMPIFGGIFKQADRLGRWLGGTFVPWLGDAISSIGTFVADVWRGMIKGIEEAVDAFWDWLMRVGKAAQEYMNRLWKRGSPSGWTKDLFRDVIQGMVEGVKDRRRALVSEIGNTMSEAQRAMDRRTIGRLPDIMIRQGELQRHAMRLESAGQERIYAALRNMADLLQHYAERPMKFKLFLGEDELKEFVINVQEETGRDQIRSGAARVRNRF